MIVTNPSVGDIVNMVTSGTCFAFTRWGDGEWACVFGEKGANKDMHKYSPALQQALISVLDDGDQPGMIWGLQRLAKSQSWKKIKKYREDWAEADIFHRASVAGDLLMLSGWLESESVVMVGPKHLRKLDFYDHFVEVPSRNSFLELPRIAEECRSLQAPGMIFAVSIGPPANVLVHELNRDHKGSTVINFGSVWEPLVGKASRNYHNKVLKYLKK